MCVFCKIIAGEIPSYKVYEDDKCIAILDISEASVGHTLIMPKAHFANILDIEEDLLKHLISVTKKLAKEYETKLNCNGFNILNNCKEVAGQTVDHFHIHLIPRYDSNDHVELSFKEHEVTDLDEVFKKLTSK